MKTILKIVAAVALVVGVGLVVDAHPLSRVGEVRDRVIDRLSSLLSKEVI